MNPDAAKTIPAGYLGEQSHAEFVREAYREQGRQQERQRIIKLLEDYVVAKHWYTVSTLQAVSKFRHYILDQLEGD